MNNSDYDIRDAVHSDSAQIATLSSQLGYAVTETQMRERLAVLLPMSTQFVAVAESEGQILGWLAAQERLILESGVKTEIVGLVVSGAHRQRGIGRALVNAAEQWRSQRGVSVMVVRSNIVREESHPFYESLGYVRSKSQHVYAKRMTE